MSNEEIIAEIDKRTQELIDEYEERYSSQWEADNCRYMIYRFEYCRRKAILEAFDKARAEGRREGKKDKLKYAIIQLKKSTRFVGTGICDEAVDDIIKELKEKLEAIK